MPRPAQMLALLRRLSDGNCHSGETLARDLGLTREEIRGQLHAIEGSGVRVERVRGRGYRLAERPDLLDRESIERDLSAAGSPLAFELLDQCDSTNSVLLERTRAGARSPQALACEIQAAGRGRRGAPWVSGLASGLTFSVVWPFQCGASGLSGLSLAVGVAMAHAIESIADTPVAVKWPNDLLRDGRKLGGILIEMNGDARGPSVTVIGVGVNVRLPSALSDRIDQPAIGLEGSRMPSRTRLLATSLIGLGESLEIFARSGFAPFRDEWMRRHAWRGRRITLRVAGSALAQGVALGAGDDGALLVRTVHGVERFHSGEPELDQ